MNPKRIWRDWRGFVVFVAVMLVFRSAIADWNQVPSGSMYPSIYVGDRIVVDKLAYGLRLPFTLHRLARWHEPERGDVVTFVSPDDERLLVKRVIGIPGDRVAMLANELVINGQRASYAAVGPQEIAALPLADAHRYDFYRESVLGDERLVMFLKATVPAQDSFAELTVPKGQYLVLGDNRDNSRDSRAIGFIGQDLILGRAQTVAFSLDYDSYYQPRLDRFFTPLI